MSRRAFRVDRRRPPPSRSPGPDPEYTHRSGYPLLSHVAHGCALSQRTFLSRHGSQDPGFCARFRERRSSPRVPGAAGLASFRDIGAGRVPPCLWLWYGVRSAPLWARGCWRWLGDGKLRSVLGGGSEPSEGAEGFRERQKFSRGGGSDPPPFPNYWVRRHSPLVKWRFRIPSHRLLGRHTLFFTPDYFAMFSNLEYPIRIVQGNTSARNRA